MPTIIMNKKTFLPTEPGKRLNAGAANCSREAERVLFSSTQVRGIVMNLRMAHLSVVVLALMVWCSTCKAGNLLVNGNFESGNVGFQSQYVNFNQPGGYLIGTNPSNPTPPPPPPAPPGVYTFGFGGTFSSFGDHTTGSGLMLMADGFDGPGQPPAVWSETIDLTGPTAATFEFTGWVASASQPGGSTFSAELAFYANGVQFGSNVLAPDVAGVWSEFSAILSLNNPSLTTIEIVDLNKGFLGNDFSLDDLSLSPVPEPSSLIMLGLGMFTLLGYGRMRRK